MLLGVSILSLSFILGVQSQENAANSVGNALRECYNKTENYDRNQRPPSTINVLIELIRKIESGPSIQNDREFSKEIIHRFKQDGITRNPLAEVSPYTVPFAPVGMRADKHKILLRTLIPGSSTNFPNETLNEVEKCSLHFMLSNTVDRLPRGDESTVCNKIGRFEMRIRRDAADPNDDVEIFRPSKSRSSRGNLQEGELDETPQAPEEQEQVETDVFQSPPDTSSRRSNTPLTLSECPIEDGTVYTQWGTIQAGIVISGMAAGREPQSIPFKEYRIDNRFAATLAGDLAEVGLYQGASGKGTVDLGAKGGWNDTQAPRFYYISKNTDLQMTDAEIRGGIDGLVMATYIEKWQSKASSLKISQLLDMYYSPRGVFSRNYRACRRRLLYKEVAPREKLTPETIAFSFRLNDESNVHGTISQDGIKAYAEKAVAALDDYITTNLRDVECPTDDGAVIVRISTDIVIVVDTQWNYNVIERTLAYLLDSLDINKYGSNFTIIGAKDGTVMVNSSSSILDLFKYNRAIHDSTPSGFDASRIFGVVEEITRRKMDEDQTNRKVAGQSTVVLFMPYSTPGDGALIESKKQNFKISLPDLRLLALGRNSKEAYSDLVFDPASDAFGLPDSTDGTTISEAVKPVVERIRQFHRRLINPACGSNWPATSTSNTESNLQYVEPNGVNYYRMVPNYFYGDGTRTVKIQGGGYGFLTACMSRQNAKPAENFTAGDVKCEKISSSTEVSFSLTDACKGSDSISQCLPAYFSIASTQSGQESTNFGCTDSGCRFPDNLKYTIKVEGMGCYSGSPHVIANFVMLITTLVTLKLLF